MHPVVLGKEIGKFKIDLIAKKANAWDSIKITFDFKGID